MKISEKYQEALKGCKNTKHRDQILEILGIFEVPATADNILEMFKYLKTPVSMSTIYRNLEMLALKGIVIKSIMMDDNKARYELNRLTDKHYIICVKCNKIYPIDYCPIENIDKKLLKDTGFDITGHKFEIYGHCPACKNSQKQKIK